VQKQTVGTLGIGAAALGLPLVLPTADEAGRLDGREGGLRVHEDGDDGGAATLETHFCRDNSPDAAATCEVERVGRKTLSYRVVRDQGGLAPVRGPCVGTRRAVLGALCCRPHRLERVAASREPDGAHVIVE